jgi:hypothetical protein
LLHLSSLFNPNPQYLLMKLPIIFRFQVSGFYSNKFMKGIL